MNEAKLMAYANEAVQAWGGALCPPALITNRENAVFRVQIPYSRAALRLHRVGYQTADAIEAELNWMSALAHRGFPCPRPLPTRTGSWIFELSDGPVASMVAWIDAKPIADLKSRPKGNREDVYHRLGALLARFHSVTDECRLEGLTRPSWLSEDLVGPDPRWGRFWENPALDPDETKLLRNAAQEASKTLAERPTSEIGLIHADVLRENVLQNDDGLWLIDFDDGGWGYRPYDLGTALVQHWDSPAYQDLTVALAEGYGRPDLTGDLSFFVMLRGLASAGWIMSRAAPTDPRQRAYAERAMALVRRCRL